MVLACYTNNTCFKNLGVGSTSRVVKLWNWLPVLVTNFKEWATSARVRAIDILILQTDSSLELNRLCLWVFPRYTT